MIRLLKIGMFLFIPLLANGQANDSSKMRRWGLEAGYQNFRTYDKNASPLIYVANNGYLGFKYQRIKPGKTWDISAAIAIGSNQAKRFGQREITTITDYNIFGEPDSIEYIINPWLSFVNATLGYHYCKRLTQTFWLGVELKDKFYYGALGADIWFFNQFSLSPFISRHWSAGTKHTVQTSLCIPILSYLVRQPYTLDPSLPIPNYFIMYLKTGSALASLNKFQQVITFVQYGYKLSERKEIGLAYKFMWLNYANYKDRNLRAYSNTFCLTYTF